MVLFGTDGTGYCIVLLGSVHIVLLGSVHIVLLGSVHILDTDCNERKSLATMSGYEIGRTILECKSCRILDLIEAHSCLGRFKQGVIEQYFSLKPGKGLQDILAQEPLSTAYCLCVWCVCVCLCVRM